MSVTSLCPPKRKTYCVAAIYVESYHEGLRVTDGAPTDPVGTCEHEETYARNAINGKCPIIHVTCGEDNLGTTLANGGVVY